MSLKKKNIKTLALLIILFNFFVTPLKSNEAKIESIADQMQLIIQDLKTLEKAVYKKSDITNTSSVSSGLNEDILTKHLLKLNEIEEQFSTLTNKFEEVSFKLDKLSNRVTKIQSDNQLRFSDLESGEGNIISQNNAKKIKKKNLPGADKPQDFGAAPGYSTNNLPKNQAIQSIESYSNY